VSLSVFDLFFLTTETGKMRDIKKLKALAAELAKGLQTRAVLKPFLA